MSAERRPSDRPSGWREAAYALGAYGAYLAVRGLVWNDRGRGRADRNARRVIALERRFGQLVEPKVQRAASRAPVLLDILSAGYAAGNVALSVGWLAWVRHRGDPGYRRERRSALFAFLGALPVFLLFPTAPPARRMASSTSWPIVASTSTTRPSSASTTRSRPCPATTWPSPSSPARP